jgi:hypothetical protein
LALLVAQELQILAAVAVAAEMVMLAIVLVVQVGLVLL